MEISIRVFTISNLLDDGDVNVSIIYYNELFWLNLMKKYNINFYNLDAFIAVGYRVYSMKATQFPFSYFLSNPLFSAIRYS